MDSENGDMSGSRKRQIDDDYSHRSGKRSNIDTQDTDDHKVQLKLLIPNVTAGVVIGKGGEQFGQLQKDNNVNMRMSKSSEVYPGTNERVCLIIGYIPDIMDVVKFIVTKGYEYLDRSGGDSNRSRELLALITNVSAGMIIGKAGSYIKAIKDDTGAVITLSQRSKDPSLPERVMRITGDRAQLLAAMEMCLEKIIVDKTNNTHPNVTYNVPAGGAPPPAFSTNSGMGGGGGASGGTGRPSRFGSTPFLFGDGDSGRGRGGDQDSFPMGNLGGSSQSLATAFGRGGGGGAGAGLFAFRGAGGNEQGYDTGAGGAAGFMGHQSVGGAARNRGSGPSSEVAAARSFLESASNNNILGFLSNLTHTLRTAGYNDYDVSEISAAMQILAKHNLLGLGMGVGVAALGGPTASLGGGLGDQASEMSGFMDRQGGAVSTLAMERPNQWVPNNSGSVLDMGPEAGAEEIDDGPCKFPVADSLAGVILGQRGKTLVEMQQLTGTKIELSKKPTSEERSGDKDPDRMVSITGQPMSVRMARQMIERLLRDEQFKRERNA